MSLLTVREVAQMLRVSPPTVRGLCETGLLPSAKVGERGLRIPKDAVDAYLRTISNNEVGIDAASPPTPTNEGPAHASPPPR